MEPEIKAAASSSSGLEFHLHPVRTEREQEIDFDHMDRSITHPPHHTHAHTSAPQLVLINISDHHTRTKVNGPPASTGPQHQHPPAGSPLRVVGCLLGQQVGRSVDIRDSFEVGLLPQEASQLDFGFLHKKLEQCTLSRWRQCGDGLYMFSVDRDKWVSPTHSLTHSPTHKQTNSPPPQTNRHSLTSM